MYKNVTIHNCNTITDSDKLISLMKREQNKVETFGWNCYQIRISKLFS